MLNSCIQVGRNIEEKKAILLADREAPLGWIYLRIFNDYSFEFESRGLERRGDIYAGSIELRGDTILFNYNNEIPKAGLKAVIGNGYVSYIDGDYPERVKIKLNELEGNEYVEQNAESKTTSDNNSNLTRRRGRGD